MKNISIIIMLLIPACLQAQLGGDTYEAAKSSGSANWTFTYANAPGFISKASNGEMSGITVDLMDAFKNYIEEKEGISVTVSYKASDANDFTRFLSDVKSARGGVFGLSNTTITTAREKYYRFSPSYITNIGLVISHKDVPAMNSLSEISEKFSGMTAVTVKNSTNASRIEMIRDKYWPGMDIEYVSSFQKAVDLVARDKSKFTDIDFTYYLSAVQAKLPVKRHAGGQDDTEKFGIIMPKSNDWAPLLEEFMNSGFVGSMEYKKIISRNLGQSAMKYLEAL